MKPKQDADARAGLAPASVSHRAKNPNIVAFLQGMNAADSDWETGDITDCPYRTRLAKRDWWRGYHHYEKMANSILCDTGNKE